MGSRILPWHDLFGTPAALALVPSMFTDVTLDRPGHTVVIETIPVTGIVRAR